MTPEQRHDQIKKRRAQIERLEKKLARVSKALRTRIQKAKRSLAAFERIQAKLGVDPVTIEAAREEAAGLASLERFIGKPKKSKPVLTTHFVLHADQKLYRAYDPATYGRAGEVLVRRTACNSYVAPTEGYAMRAATVVTCPECAALRRAWLAQAKRKPLTLRRAKALREAMKATKVGEGGCAGCVAAPAACNELGSIAERRA